MAGNQKRKDQDESSELLEGVHREMETIKLLGQSRTAIILNNYTFNDPGDNLAGGGEDTRRLKRRFHKFRFDVKAYENKTAAEMLETMNNCRTTDYSEDDCFVCFISTHGTDDRVWGTDLTVDVNELIKPIMENKTLEEKPKMFFIDACRGLDVEVKLSLPILYAETLICFSTSPGHYASMLPEEQGSIFFKALCDVFKEFGTKESILKVCEHLKSVINTNEGTAQCVNCLDNFTKQYCFQ